jgi:hypothetical protein
MWESWAEIGMSDGGAMVDSVNLKYDGAEMGPWLQRRRTRHYLRLRRSSCPGLRRLQGGYLCCRSTLRRFSTPRSRQAAVHRTRENRGNKNYNLRLCPTVYRAPFDTPRRWRRERRSVHVTNVGLLALLGALALVLGWQRVAMIHVC